MTSPDAPARSVPTVTGQIDASRLGRTLIHEHVAIGFDGCLLDSRVNIDRADTFAAGQAAVMGVKNFGVTTLVDATPLEMGRDPVLLREVSEATGVNIICATGLYTSDHGIPYYFREMPMEDLADLYTQEITVGIGETGIRAGVIKVATASPPLKGVERKVLLAAAVAQRRTGTPIVSHTTGGGGDEQAKILLEGGAHPDKIVIGHVDHKDSSMRYLLRILRSGVSLGFDRVGLDVFLPEPVRAALVAGLLGAGHVERMFLATDSYAVWLGPEVKLSPGQPAPPPPYVHLFTSFLPALKAMGVTQAQIDQVLIDNPRRLFS